MILSKKETTYLVSKYVEDENDVNNFTTGLGFADGQTTWKVFDSEMTEYKTFEDVPDRFKTQLHRGMNAFYTSHRTSFHYSDSKPTCGSQIFLRMSLFIVNKWIEIGHFLKSYVLVEMFRK